MLHPSMLTESWVKGKSVEEKDAQPTERTAALWRLSSKINSRIWVNFTRNGLRLGSRHQELPHTDVSRNLATVVIRGALPGLRRITGLLPSGKRTKDLNYFSLCALNLFNTQVSQFDLNYRNKWTFPRHSNLWRCTCVCAYIYIYNYFLWRFCGT